MHLSLFGFEMVEGFACGGISVVYFEEEVSGIGEVCVLVAADDFIEVDEVRGANKAKDDIALLVVIEAEGEGGLAVSIEGGEEEVGGVIGIRQEGVGAEGELDSNGGAVLVQIGIKGEVEFDLVALEFNSPDVARAVVDEEAALVNQASGVRGCVDGS